MDSVVWPTAAKIISARPGVESHSRGGGESDSGHYKFKIGGGARVVWSINVAPMCFEDALNFRGFLHSLRGRSGSFLLRVPSKYKGVTPTATLSAAVAIGDESLTSSVWADGEAEVGEWLRVGDTETGQLTRIVAVSGGTSITVRPRLRAAYATSTAIATGSVQARFRLADETPFVPIGPAHAQGFTFSAEEYY